jgi:(p)ppGpp synthase/HD superfamily hydrolase
MTSEVTKPQPSLTDTIDLMVKCHMGQLDKGGKPYYLHPLRVMMRIRNAAFIEQQAALLHDVVEDTSMTLDGLRGLGYSKGVIILVDLLTRRKGESHRDYMDRLVQSGNYGAICVKLADVTDNSSPARIAQLPEAERGMAKRYERDRGLLLSVIAPEPLSDWIITGDM